MSLDVYLNMPDAEPRAGSGIFVRENGSTVEISREEWDRRYPGREPVTFVGTSDEVYSANITHNLNHMADAAGIYKELWRPEEIGITKAAQLIAPLRAGLDRMRAQADHLKTFNPANGWGDYEGLVEFTAKYLAACEMHPDATVSVSR